MPHDVNGQQVENGSVVTLRAVISNLSPGEKACNCTFTVLLPRGVDEDYAPSFAGNTRLGAIDADPREAPALPPPIQNVYQFFAFAHLPPHLQAASRPFHDLATRIARGPSNPETTVALRKLLEAKDAAVRALLFKA